MSKSPTSNHVAIATVWLIDGRTVGETWLREHEVWLSDGEMNRYSRFVREERKRQFLIGRILLRHAVSELAGTPSKSIHVVEQPNLAPKLEGIAPMPWFSISHSGPWIACATSSQTAVGLDIEMMDAGRDLIGLAEQVFGAEAEAITRLQGTARLTAFYEAWSRKEAGYKLDVICNCAPIKNYTVLSHPEVSIVLCSALPLEKALIRNIAAENILLSS